MVAKKFQNVVWQADEYLARKKNKGWFVGLGFAIILLVGLAVWFQWWSFAALIVVSALALLIYVIRPPKKVHYTLGAEGLSEGSKLYGYDEFKSFSVVKEKDFCLFSLIPRKRFSGRVIVLFPEEKGAEIVDILGMRLPMEDFKMDLIDKIVWFLKI